MHRHQNRPVPAYGHLQSSRECRDKLCPFLVIVMVVVAFVLE